MPKMDIQKWLYGRCDEEMTDNEIIKALECCAKFEDICLTSCPMNNIYNNPAKCLFTLSNNALNLINRQKAEIERLEKGLMQCKLEKEMLYHVGMEIKTVSIKEFAERLKKERLIDRGYEILSEGTIDNLVKEMTENDFKEE